MRQRAGVHRHQPQPGPDRWLLDRPAAVRQVVVPGVREDGELDIPAMIHVSPDQQPRLPLHRRALHQRRHDGVHAVPHLGRARASSRRCVDHPARRRRGAVPLGPLPWPGAGQQVDAGAGADLKNQSSSTPASTTSPASTCCSRSCRWTTSSSARRWWAPCVASTPRPASTTTTRSATSTPLGLDDAQRTQVFEGNVRKVFPRFKG